MKGRRNQRCGSPTMLCLVFFLMALLTLGGRRGTKSGARRSPPTIRACARDHKCTSRDGIHVANTAASIPLCTRWGVRSITLVDFKLILPSKCQTHPVQYDSAAIGPGCLLRYVGSTMKPSQFFLIPISPSGVWQPLAFPKP